MNKKKTLILLLLLTVCFCAPFLLNNDKKLQMQKVEVLNEKIIGTQPIIKVKELKSRYDITIDKMNQKMEEIKSIEDKKEWFIAYKSIVEEYSYIMK